jgi:hypothetical protein
MVTCLRLQKNMQHNKNCERFRRLTFMHSSNSNGNCGDRFDCIKDVKSERGQGRCSSHHHRLHCCTPGVPQGSPPSWWAFRRQGSDKRGLLLLAGTNACFCAGQRVLNNTYHDDNGGGSGSSSSTGKEQGVVAVAVWWRRQWRCLMVAVAVDVRFGCCILLVVGKTTSQR